MHSRPNRPQTSGPRSSGRQPATPGTCRLAGLLCALFAIAAFAGPAAAQPLGNPQDLGTLGGDYASGNAVSADGTTIVGSSSTAGGTLRAFRWTASGGMQNLGGLGGGDSEARDVSADGSVVVGNAEIAQLNNRAFRWTVSGGMQSLGSLSSFSSYASAVSDDGQVVVGWAVDSDFFYRAFRWTAASGMQDLGTLGGAESYARGVSADGSVVVGDAMGTQGTFQPFRWTAATGMTLIGSPERQWGRATDVSADGSVVVGSWAEFADGTGRRPGRWTESNGLELFDMLPGAVEQRPLAVSADGRSAVGELFDNNSIYSAFRWTECEGSRLLRGISGAPSFATGVSADGSVIAGSSNNLQSAFNLRAFRIDLDTDDDGLIDDWETHGVAYRDSGGVLQRIPLPGADPMRKDVFIEMDSMTGQFLPANSLLRVIQAFDDAPVDNPGSADDGIALHIIPDETIDNIPFWSANTGNMPGGIFETDFADVRAAHFGPAGENAASPGGGDPLRVAARAKAFRYLIIGDQGGWGSGQNGLTDAAPGANAVVFAGVPLDDVPQGISSFQYREDAFAGILMHEIGHMLGLKHGGHDSVNGKPNYPSVMNYMRMAPLGPQIGPWDLDYSREGLIDPADPIRGFKVLDENFLSESQGISTPSGYYATRNAYYSGHDPNAPLCDVLDLNFDRRSWYAAPMDGSAIDFNRIDGITVGFVIADLNYVCQSPYDSPPERGITQLEPHDDWANLVYAVPTDYPGFATGGVVSTPFEMEHEQWVSLLADIRDDINPGCPADFNADGAVNILDVIAFIAEWDAAGPNADFNADGNINIIDVTDFINTWNAGCP